ncbi:transglycosylase domain-containing protein [Clostridium sp. AN503]|uniref:transglycosylase domain-containing protein n=1 Tax=Clostridium sp. AN503 TaxID=3160598 RepID=UPI003459387E
MRSRNTIKAILKGIASFFVSLFGILGWLLQAMMQLLTATLIIGALAALLIYVKAKPDLDYCREVAYDKLSQMQRQDFRMLSDTEIYDKDNQLIGLINAGHYEYVPIDKISLNIQNAYIAQEDRRFKSHTGVDWIATFRAGLALVKNRGEITQGGSTITQQVIKNTYLTQEQSFTRKIVEILLAPEVEKEYSKADIMEFYCNTNFYGNHCYGVQAASRYYFGKNADELQPYEAAVLVGLSNSPTAYDPIKNPEAALTKRNDVLHSMYEVGYLTREEYDADIAQSLSIVQEEAEGTDENYQSSYAIHCAALQLMALDGFEFQYTFEDKDDYDSYVDRYQTVYNEKNDEIRAGGYRIYTSLDNSLQQVLQAQIDNGLSSYTELQDNGKFALQGAGVIVDNQTNYVVAIVGGRGTEDMFNRAYLSARQPGSTIKPLIDYGPAFDTGEYYPARMVDDHKWEDGPSNSGGHYYGNVTVREALNRSLNTVAWQILTDIGVNFGLDYLGQMDFLKLTYIDNDVPSLSIGGFTNGVRVVDMAKGYSTLANSGVYNDRTCIRQIDHEQQGNLTKDLKPHARQVYQEDSAYMLTDILKGTLTESYGTGYGLALDNDMPAAGKTGTTNSSKDTWFCGYTRYYTTAVWVGYDIPRAMPGIYGKTYAGKIWKQVMDQIHTGKEPWDWEQPATVEEQPDEKTGITDLVSATAKLRAEQSLHDKEQRRLEDELKASVDEFENKTIETVEDTYWVKNRYQSLVSKLNLMDEGELRGELLERVTSRYEEFSVTIKEMQSTIALYEKQKEREQADAQKRAEETAEKRRKELEIQTRKNEFLIALRDVENLEYQAPNASELIQTAISKLPLVADYEEAASYSTRLDAAISRVSTLPTAEEWQMMEEKKAAEEAAAQESVQQQISQEQSKLEGALNQEQKKWNNSTPHEVGPGVSPSPVVIPGPEGE